MPFNANDKVRPKGVLFADAESHGLVIARIPGSGDLYSVRWPWTAPGQVNITDGDRIEPFDEPKPKPNLGFWGHIKIDS
jgi:hypothetical protein